MLNVLNLLHLKVSMSLVAETVPTAYSQESGESNVLPPQKDVSLMQNEWGLDIVIDDDLYLYPRQVVLLMDLNVKLP